MYFLQIIEDVSHRPLQKFLAVGRECIFPYQSESNMREMETVCLSKEGLKPFSCICSAVFCISFYCFFLSFHTQITSRLTMLTEVGIAAQCNSLVIFLSGSIQMQYQHLAHACHTLPVAFGSHLQVFHTSSFFL